MSNDLNRISAGKGQYNLFCNEDGGVIDDLIIYEYSGDDIFIIPNAANCAKVAADLQEFAPPEIVVQNIHQDYGVFAVQGALSGDVLKALGLDLNLDYMSFTTVALPKYPQLGELIIARTGYSG